MRDTTLISKFFSRSALVGAALAVLCGLLLWGAPLFGLGDWYVNTSYDYLYRFGSRAATNDIVLVLMDNESYGQLQQPRDAPWDRRLHAQLMKKLADDQSALVVFDVHFRATNNAATDSALAAEMRRHGHVVLMADSLDAAHPGLDSAGNSPPAELFRTAAAGFGVGHADPPTLQIARRHWPFFSPGEGDFRSLGWAAAAAFGARLNSTWEQQWLRYYGERGPWQVVSYSAALEKPPGFFRGKIVFIGNDPEKTDPGFPEKDKFLTPYTHWNSEAVGGTKIMATTFLNLVNADWLRRPPAWSEALLLVFSGIFIGGGLCRLKPLASLAAAAGIFLVVMLVFVSLSYYTNFWFPWFVIAGGQVPCGLAWAWAFGRREPAALPDRFPGYQTIGDPFGRGAYGRVWLVRNALGQLQALKEVERSRFADAGPYDREFRGITLFKPISSQHPGLLHIDHVNRDEAAGFFYYVMELGDALNSGWEQKNEAYHPRDLASVCEQAEGGRLPVRECLRIGIGLLDTLDFLHQRGLVHRDIKPANVIFVNGQPKLADVGLVRDVTPESTLVGTPEYMPPAPEPLGTTTADIYAVGKLLYVISTGKPVAAFSELPTELAEQSEFMRLNDIICRACQPAADQRYESAAAMLTALRALQSELNADQTRLI